MGVLRPDLMMKCIIPVVMAGIIAVSLASFSSSSCVLRAPSSPLSSRRTAIHAVPRNRLCANRPTAKSLLSSRDARTPTPPRCHLPLLPYRGSSLQPALSPRTNASIPQIYGLVVSVLISGDLKSPMSLYTGFIQLGAGLSVGLAGLSAGFAIGIVGDAGVRGVAQQSRVFVSSRCRREEGRS